MNRKVLRIGFFSQVIYYGGYSGEDPPLPIPNREVKLTIADGTDPPVGRVGSRRSSIPGTLTSPGDFFVLASLERNVGYRRSTPRRCRGRPPGGEVHPKSWTVNNVFICNEFDTVSDSFRLTVI